MIPPRQSDTLPSRFLSCSLGAGFVGSHLVERLLKLNVGRVILLDNFNDYYSPAIKQRNVDLIEARFPNSVVDGRLIVIRGSINDTNLLNLIFKKYPITRIAHLAVSDNVCFRCTEILSLSLSGTSWCSFIQCSDGQIHGSKLFRYPTVAGSGRFT